MQKLLLELFALIGLTSIDATNYQVTDSPLEEGDKVIGEMNDLEKTCLMFLEQKKQEHKELHVKMDAETDEGSENYLKLQHEHHLLMEAMGTVKKVMWTSVASRFAPEKDSTGAAFRDGNKVVMTFGDKDDDMMSHMPGVTVIRIGRK